MIALPVTEIDDSLPVMFVVDSSVQKKNERKNADKTVNFVFSSALKVGSRRKERVMGAVAGKE